MSELTRLLLYGLAAGRIAMILTEAAGPASLFDRLRLRVDPAMIQARGSFGELFSCVRCMSVWVGTLLAACWFALLSRAATPLRLRAGVTALFGVVHRAASISCGSRATHHTPPQ